jgi:hypothetical protein
MLHDWKASISDTTEAIKLAPDDSVAYKNRAAALACAGDWNGAVEAYTRLRGQMRQRLGDERGADDDFERAGTLEGASTGRP